MPNVIHSEIESLIRKIYRCANNPEKYSTTKIGEHITCILYFFKKRLKIHIDFENKKILLLIKKELKSYKDAKVSYICRKKSWKNFLQVKIIEKLEIIIITQENIEAQHIVFVI